LIRRVSHHFVFIALKKEEEAEEGGGRGGGQDGVALENVGLFW